MFFPILNKKMMAKEIGGTRRIDHYKPKVVSIALLNQFMEAVLYKKLIKHGKI
jgi:hypothetical protein